MHSVNARLCPRHNGVCNEVIVVCILDQLCLLQPQHKCHYYAMDMTLHIHHAMLTIQMSDAFIKPTQDLSLSIISQWILPVNVLTHLIKFISILFLLCGILDSQYYLAADTNKCKHVATVGAMLIVWWCWYYRPMHVLLQLFADQKWAHHVVCCPAFATMDILTTPNIWRLDTLEWKFQFHMNEQEVLKAIYTHHGIGEWGQKPSAQLLSNVMRRQFRERCGSMFGLSRNSRRAKRCAPNRLC